MDSSFVLPFRFKLIEFPVHPDVMSVWVQSNMRVWAEMEKEDKGEAVPWMADVHSDNYGPCEMYKACFEYQWDETLMAEDYVKRERG